MMIRSNETWLSLLLAGWHSATGNVLSSLMGLSETSETLTRVSQDVLSSLMGLSETSGTLTRVSQSLGITKEQAKLVKICSR